MSMYTCSICGAPLTPAHTHCPQCGTELAWEQTVGRVRYVKRLPKLGMPRGPRMRTLLLLSFIITGALAVLILAGLWGIERGLEERRAVIGDVAFEHYRQGVLLLLDGNIENARAEFNQVIVVELKKTPTPTITSTATISPTPTAGPSPTPPPPSPTPSLNQLALDEALAQIQTLMDSGQWEEAIAQLQELNDLDPGYQAGLIGQMLFNAHYNLALAYEKEGDVDGMLRELDEALKLRPGNTAAMQLKKTIDLYRTGKAQMGVDWEAAISAFTELFALEPDFQDTPEQLFLAYAGYGDSLRRTDPCGALERYRLAIQLKRDPQVRAKLEDARIRCEPPDSIADGSTPSAPASGGPTPTAASGRIAYTFFDESRTFHRTRLWDVETSSPISIIADESLQPDIGPQGWIVVRSTNAERYGLTMFEAPGRGARRLTKEAGDTLPRWSPDGKRILFTSTSRTEDRASHIFILDVETGKIKRVAAGAGPDWAPDGERIVYRKCDGQGEACGLWILDLNTGEERQLTTNAGDAMPTWSPDGRLIAFMSNGRSPGWDIFIVDAATGNIPFFALDDADDGLPVWSPDGQFIAFLSNREGDWAVYAWSLDDLSVHRLFPVEGPLPAWQEAGLDWAR